MKYIIRKAEIGDAKAVAKVHVETWQSHYKGQISDEYLNRLSVEKKSEMWEKDFASPEEKSETFIAEIDKTVVGFCSVGKSRDKDSIDSTGEIYAIYLDQSKQGEGIGKVLMDTGLSFLKKQGFIKATLWVLQSNKKTISFYESQGWKPDGTEMKSEENGFLFEEIRLVKSL